MECSDKCPIELEPGTLVECPFKYFDADNPAHDWGCLYTAVRDFHEERAIVDNILATTSLRMMGKAKEETS